MVKSQPLLFESKINQFLINENKRSLVEAALDSNELGIESDFIYKIYEANNVLIRDLMLVECRYGDFDEKELLNEKFLDKLASKVKGGLEFGKQLVTTGDLDRAKSGYNAASTDSRTQYFKNAIGDALNNIKKFDTADETGLKAIDKFAGIDIKASKSAAGAVASKAAAGVAKVAGTIKDKAGQVISTAYEKAIQAAVSTFFKTVELITKGSLKIQGGIKAVPELLQKLAAKIKPNLTVAEDKGFVDKLIQLAKQNPGYSNILVGFFISLSKVALIAVGVAASKALIISAVLGIIIRTMYGKYIKGETLGAAFKKALIVTASTILIGSLLKGIMAVFHHGDFLTGFKSYFVGGDAAAQQAAQQIGDIPTKDDMTDIFAMAKNNMYSGQPPEDALRSVMGDEQFNKFVHAFAVNDSTGAQLKAEDRVGTWLRAYFAGKDTRYPQYAADVLAKKGVHLDLSHMGGADAATQTTTDATQQAASDTSSQTTTDATQQAASDTSSQAKAEAIAKAKSEISQSAPTDSEHIVPAEAPAGTPQSIGEVNFDKPEMASVYAEQIKNHPFNPDLFKNDPKLWEALKQNQPGYSSFYEKAADGKEYLSLVAHNAGGINPMGVQMQMDSLSVDNYNIAQGTFRTILNKVVEAAKAGGAGMDGPSIIKLAKAGQYADAVNVLKSAGVDVSDIRVPVPSNYIEVMKNALTKLATTKTDFGGLGTVDVNVQGILNAIQEKNMDTAFKAIEYLSKAENANVVIPDEVKQAFFNSVGTTTTNESLLKESVYKSMIKGYYNL